MNKFIIKLQVPKEYKWIAIQPWGQLVAFKDKPTIYKAVEHQDEDGFIPSYWKVADGFRFHDELPITESISNKGWRKSLCKIV